MRGIIFNTIKFALIWGFALGFATVVVAPLYLQLLEKIGPWTYLLILGLGFLTERFFILKAEADESTDN
tara:strand:+ start:3159 stop:3365 length:207 start_codon:yes stop_codon:yes gene_type:complete